MLLDLYFHHHHTSPVGWFGYDRPSTRPPQYQTAPVPDRPSTRPPQYQTADEVRKERIRLGILPPDVEDAVTKAAETAIAKREARDAAGSHRAMQSAEMALQADLAQLDRQVTDAIRRLLYLEYMRLEIEQDEAQIVMLLFEM